MIVHDTPVCSPLPVLGDRLPVPPEAIPSYLRPTWKLVAWWAKGADQIDIHPSRNPYGVDGWCENPTGVPTNWEFQLSRGQHILTISSLKMRNPKARDKWSADLLERSAETDDSGLYLSVVRVWDSDPLPDNRGRASALKAIAKRCRDLGRPWPEYATYRTP